MFKICRLIIRGLLKMVVLLERRAQRQENAQLLQDGSFALNDSSRGGPPQCNIIDMKMVVAP